VFCAHVHHDYSLITHNVKVMTNLYCVSFVEFNPHLTCTKRVPVISSVCNTHEKIYLAMKFYVHCIKMCVP
jgi:hypothetical protein